MKNDLYSDIGKRIRYKRTQLGISREELAERIGISSRFLADIELGAKGMSFSTLISIVNELQVSTDYILMGKEPKSTTESIEDLISEINEKYLPPLEGIIREYLKATEIK